MRYLFRSFLLLFIWQISLSALAQNKPRQVVDFNTSWKFYLGAAETAKNSVFNDANWRSLNLPHDWSIEGTFSKDHPATPGGGALPGGMGWYRKTFQIPASSKGKLIFIDFEGVYRNSEVWINGHYLDKRPNGYLPFRYELSRFLNYEGKNVIAVKVDNSKQPNSRWYSGSGIYRNVWLTTVNPVHIPQFGTFITTPLVSKKEAEVLVQTIITNRSLKTLNIVLRTEIYNHQGKQVAVVSETSALAAGSSSRVDQNVKINNPQVWSVTSPVLYKALSRVFINDKLTDSYETTFGIRSFNFDINKGFTLNGESLKIQGVCNHHDLGALGSAFNKRAAERQLQILKDMGCNGIRTSHNPPASELLDLCDEMGFIVMDESFDMWKKKKNPYDYHLDWDQWHRTDLEDQIKRDRNHPSVFMWSVGNEIQEQWGDEKKGDTTGRVIARELVAIVKRLDTTRAITSANNEIHEYNNLLKSGAFDLIGYNYNDSSWASFHDRWPGKKFIVTESTSALETRGHYDLVPYDSIRKWPEAWDKPIKGGGNADFTVSAYDHVIAPWGSTHERSLQMLQKSPHVSGMFVWTGFDYLGEPTPYPWPARSSYFGIIDLAGFPKDVYYLYKSVWTNTPVLHIYPHWNWKSGDTVDVVAYYNQADEVELYLNGKSLGIQKKLNDEMHVKWRVPYAAGKINAISRKDGKAVLTAEVNTAGKAAKIELIADRNKIKGDGKDLSFVTIRILDNAGNVVPDADHLVNLKVKGAGFLKAVDNGNPVSHESFKASSRKAFNGLALAIIQSGATNGDIVVEATSTGLSSIPITINVK